MPRSRLSKPVPGGSASSGNAVKNRLAEVVFALHGRGDRIDDSGPGGDDFGRGLDLDLGGEGEHAMRGDDPFGERVELFGKRFIKPLEKQVLLIIAGRPVQRPIEKVLRARTSTRRKSGKAGASGFASADGVDMMVREKVRKETTKGTNYTKGKWASAITDAGGLFNVAGGSRRNTFGTTPRGAADTRRRALACRAWRRMPDIPEKAGWVPPQREDQRPEAGLLIRYVARLLGACRLRRSPCDSRARFRPPISSDGHRPPR